MNPLFHDDFSISDSLKFVRKSVLIYETIIIVLVIVFFVTWNKYLDIEYPGGRIRLKVKKYGMKNIIAFQKSIYRVKDAQMKDLYSINS